MAAGHDTHALYHPGSSPIHRLPPEVKIVAAVGFTAAVVSTPREAVWAFGAYALLVGLVAAVARIPPGWLARRAVIELPILALALALPFLAAGERIGPVSIEGLWGGWNILAKATLGLAASLLLAGTTTLRDLILGLDRLRCPTALTQIATFMLRYLDVLVDEAKRMRVARIARGDDPRFLWQVRGFAAGLGALFLRSYERGERVWLAMRARGWTGRLPRAVWHDALSDGEAHHRGAKLSDLAQAGAATARQWTVAASLPVAAVAVAVTAAVMA